MTKVMLKQFSSSRYYLYIILSITMFSGFILSATKAFAEDTDFVDQVNITVPESCTMSGTGMNTHNADIQNNTYTTDIGTTTLHAFCNDNGGFAIYAVGYTGNEIGSTNSTKLVGSPSTIGNIDTGTAENGNTSNWAMKLTKTQDSGDTTGTNAFTIDNSFNAYHAVPSAYTKVAHKDTATDMAASTGGVKLTTTYAAFISKTQPAGTYSGQVKFTLVHPATETPLQPQTTQSGKICYYPNGSNVEGTMGCQTIPDSSTTDGVSPTSAILLASNFSRTGYGFAGWSKTYDYSDSTGFLGPQEDITFTVGEYTGNNPGLSLYARWIKSVGNLQGWTGCSSLASGAVTALTDQRDGETYAVAKLADGNCWMIENMRLENTNSDNVNGALAQGYNSSFVGLADPEAAIRFDDKYTTANTLYSTDGSTKKTISGSDQASRFPRYNNVNTPTVATDRPTNPTSNYATNSTSNASMYSYGNYYTWHAAIADTTAYTTNNLSISGTSICPSSWYLPKGGDKTNEVNNEFWALVVTGINSGTNPYNYNSSTQPYYNSTPEGSEVSSALRTYPNNFVYSGYIYVGVAGYRGSSGTYWSSTTYSNINAYYLFLRGTRVSPGTTNDYKHSGRSIRCVTPGA